MMLGVVVFGVELGVVGVGMINRVDQPAEARPRTRAWTRKNA